MNIKHSIILPEVHFSGSVENLYNILSESINVSSSIQTASYIENTVIVDVFTASGIWNKPENAKYVEVLLIGGGAGGGSGRVGAVSSSITGGTGGPGAGKSFITFPGNYLNSTENVIVGLGSLGASKRTTINTNGLNGAVAETSSFGNYIFAGGLAVSQGGNTTPRFNQGASNNNTFVGGLGGGTAITGSSTAGGIGHGGAAGGGGGGGGFSSTNQLVIPGVGGKVGGINLSDTAFGANGISNFLFAGAGGGGGTSSFTGDGQNGGHGGLYGGGGGGGGGARNGFSSGAGGNGAPGIVIITTYL